MRLRTGEPLSSSTQRKDRCGLLPQAIAHDAGYPDALSALLPFPADVRCRRQNACKVLRFLSSHGAAISFLADLDRITFKPHLQR